MSDVPPWADALLRAKVGDEPVRRAEVLRDTAFGKMVLAVTPSRAFVAERGLFGARVYAVPLPSEAAPAMRLPPAASAVPAEPRGERAPPHAGKRVPGTDEVVGAIEGIGEAYGAKLAAIGITTVGQLVARPAGAIAIDAGVPMTLVAKWQAMGRLQFIKGVGPQYSELLVRTGITDLASLAATTPKQLAGRLNAYQESLGAPVQGNAITPALVGDWIRQARQLTMDEL